jgi:alpha-glucosidase
MLVLLSLSLARRRGLARARAGAFAGAFALAAAALPIGAQAVPEARGVRAARAAAPAADRWWQEGVVYQVYPRSFQDSDGDGVGDLRGITRRLDYLEWLGVDAIWISPFFPSPMRDFGYDVSDFTGVDPMFGTMADFERLAREAHARGIRVILDFVGNHTSDRHPWFAASRASRTNPKRDWYVWRDPAPNGGPPNNWLSIFGGSAWTLDPVTGQYYYHQFLREQPDLNWRNPAVQQAMFDAMRFWLDRGADGFRLDAIPHLVEDSLFRDNPPNPGYRPDAGDAARQLWVYTFDRPETREVLCQMRRVVDEYAARDGRARVLIGETGMPPERLMAYYGSNGCGAQLPSNFGLQGAPWNADTLYSRISAYTRALAEGAPPAGRWPNWVLGNHDNHRLATRLGPEAARAAAVLLLTLRGTPTIYYGDELGMHDVPIPANQVQDPAEKNQPGLGLGRDPERTPMQWEAAPGAGFTTGRPWLPIAADAGQVNVVAARADSASVLTLYHRLLLLRRAGPALTRGTFRLLPRQGDVLAYVRETPTGRSEHGADGGRFFVAVNLSAAPVAYTLAPAEVTQLTDSGRRTVRAVAGTHAPSPAMGTLDRVDLRANEAVVLQLTPTGPSTRKAAEEP